MDTMSIIDYMIHSGLFVAFGIGVALYVRHQERKKGDKQG
ncbi:hypothetical protein SAMN05660831_00097 [Thiohalospira halophila DSM 15071]|uniref:Uncharacterized protein n=1 Tax=Thiohalospira halophila DSM 15071 TaxID=1123397 RepID=A0A1I1NA75_9GAMM|nr:hypothetical protein SAMN05660831_00097 [Thiohalospira halophila DSM 15071]